MFSNVIAKKYQQQVNTHNAFKYDCKLNHFLPETSLS